MLYSNYFILPPSYLRLVFTPSLAFGLPAGRASAPPPADNAGGG